MPFDHFLVGVDYCLPRGWVDFDISGIGADLDLIAGLGLDAIRLTLPWQVFGPSPERASQVATGKLLAVLDAAHERGLRAIVALLSGVPEYLGDRSPWSHPEALRAQVRQIGPICDRFGTHAAVLAWDIGATPDASWTAPSSGDEAWLWSHVVGGMVKRKAPQPLAVTLAEEGTGRSDFEADLAGVSVDMPGPYARWPLDPLVPAFRADLARALSGKPVVVMRLDAPGEDEELTLFHREALVAIWKSGASGVFAAWERLRQGDRLRPHAQELADFAAERRSIQQGSPAVAVQGVSFGTEPETSEAQLYREYVP